MNKLFAAAVLSATALCAASLSAQTTTPPARVLKGDTDSNGALSRAEFAALAQARFDSLDADKNGQVTREERRSARVAMRGKRHDRMMRGGRGMGGSRMLERLDSDKDGRVSRSEYDAVSAQMGARAAARGVAPADVGKRMADRFARIDANSDGYIDAAERAARPRRALRTAPGGNPPSGT